MGSRQFRPTTHKARTILSTRDYDAARKQLKQALKQPGWLREEERIEALTRELADFENRFLMRERWLAIEWAECVFIPGLDQEGAPRRRWSDLQHA
jgi:tRNA pseudouridine-54 N-methylase